MTMPLLVLGFTWAQVPPDPPDVDVLMERAKAGVAAIPGCFNLVGTAHDRWDAGLFGRGERTVEIGGNLDGGAWSRWYVEVKAGEPYKEHETRGSMFGRFPSPDGGEPERPRGGISLEAHLEDEVATDYVEPDAGGWRLIHTLKGGDAGRNDLTVRFDPTGRPWRWTVNLVEAVQVKGNRGKGKIEHMLVDLEAAPDGAPLRETMKGRFKSWPFAVDVDSVVEWKHTPCPTVLAPAFPQ